MILIFVSFENKRDAEKVAYYLIDNKLAACVSIVPVQSFYYWKRKKMSLKEYEAIIKTKKEKFDTIEKAIKELLQYEIPQLIAIEVSKVNKDYLNWLEQEARS